MLSVIIPLFNEESSILEVLRRVLTVELPVDREVILVDDFSTDSSRELLAAQGENPSVRIVLRHENGGKGAAVRSGLEHAKGDLILIQDADLEYDPTDWPALLAPVLAGSALVVYGSRFANGRPSMTTVQWVGNRLLTTLTSVLYRAKLTDMETCYKLLDRSVIEKMDLRARGFELEPEITAKVLRQGIKIVEVPIRYSPRTSAEGKKISWRHGWPALKMLVRERFR